MLQSSAAWCRRGWLVVLRSRHLAEIVGQPDHSHAAACPMSVRDAHLVHESSSATAGLGEEGGMALVLRDGGHARTDWSDAVVWLVRGTDESLLRNIVRFL